MAKRFDNVIQRVRALLEALDEGGRVPTRERIEETLTEGYAAALTLDGERLRLERRMDEVAAHVAQGGGGRVKEMQIVLEELETTEENLAELRDLLATLRDRAAVVAA